MGSQRGRGEPPLWCHPSLGLRLWFWARGPPSQGLLLKSDEAAGPGPGENLSCVPAQLCPPRSALLGHTAPMYPGILGGAT